MLFSEPQTLIVVYKDELLVNQLKKLVETKDDISEDEIKGTRDDSIRIVAWTEKVWADQKKAGNINNKILFLGNIKGVDNLLPILELKFDSYGIKYGWAGNQAALVCDSKALVKPENYNAFLAELNKYELPEILKGEEHLIQKDDSQSKDDKAGFFNKVSNFIAKSKKTVSTKIQDTKTSLDKKIKKQQYFYGIMKLYENHLEEFMNK